MARTRTTIRRVDPWSILKFAFVANVVLLGIQLLAGTVLWYVIQRLELIQTVCELAATVGFEECGVDGSALFDTVLVLGLLGVVIQTGILVFLTFLANLIFDLTGGIVVTLEDDRAPASSSRSSAGVGARSQGGSSFSRGSAGSAAGAGGGQSSRGRTTSMPRRSAPTPDSAATPAVAPPVPGGGDEGASDTAALGSVRGPADGRDRAASDDDTLFGRS